MLVLITHWPQAVHKSWNRSQYGGIRGVKIDTTTEAEKVYSHKHKTFKVISTWRRNIVFFVFVILMHALD